MDLDLQRYEGHWYEIGVSKIAKMTFEKRCVCSRTKFTKQEQGFQVEEMCNLYRVDGPFKKIKGTGIQPFQEKGSLLVTYFFNIYTP